LNKLSLILPIVLAASSIIYELGFAYSLSIIYPNTYLHYSLVIGIFIFGLGIGTTIYTFFKNKYNLNIIFGTTETVLILLVPIFLFILLTFTANTSTLILLYAIVLAVGICSGIEIPLLTDILNTKFNNVLSLDYLGTLLGTLLFSLYLLPEHGIIITLLLTTIINAITFLFFKNSLKIISIFLMTLITTFLFLNTFEELWINRWKKVIEEKELCLDRNCTAVITEIQNTHYQTIVKTDITYHSLLNEKKEPFINQCVYIDKEVQFCNTWEETYHQLLGSFPLELYTNYLNKKPNVLVVGGGDSYLYEKLKPFVSSIKVVDIDEKFSKSYFSDVKDLIIDDAFHYLLGSKENFDIIFWDLPMPTNKNLLTVYSQEMFSLVFNSLKKDGFFVHYVPLEEDKVFVPFANLIKHSGFTHSYMYKGGHVKEDKEKNKNTPFMYEEYFMISLKNDLKLENKSEKYKKLELTEVSWKNTNFELMVNSVIKPNPKFVLSY